MRSGKKQMEERIKMIKSKESKSRLISITLILTLILLIPLMFTSPVVLNASAENGNEHSQLPQRTDEQTEDYDIQKLEIIGALHGLTDVSLEKPSALGISMEKAVQQARNDLTEVIGLSPEEAKQLKQVPYFIAMSAEGDSIVSAWLILHVSDSNELIARSLLSQDGLFIDVAKSDNPFFRSHVPKSFANFEAETNHPPLFANLSLEEKVKQSEEWRALIDEHLRLEPNYKGEDGLAMYHATRFKYGLPDANDITQEEALELAVKAAEMIGANIEAFDISRSFFFFDITNPELPLWKITLMNPDGGERYIFRVLLDARTGDTILALEVPLGVPFWEYYF